VDRADSQPSDARWAVETKVVSSQSVMWSNPINRSFLQFRQSIVDSSFGDGHASSEASRISSNFAGIRRSETTHLFKSISADQGAKLPAELDLLLPCFLRAVSAHQPSARLADSSALLAIS